MKQLINSLFIAVLLTACSGNTEPSEDLVHFRVTPDFNEEILKVDVSYRSDSTGKIILKYENDSWGDQDIYNCIHKLTTVPEADSILFDKEESFITVYTQPNSLTEINYEIKQDFEAPLLNQHRYRPIMEDSYFHLLGMRLFILKDDLFENEESEIRLKVEVILPDSMSFHSSFGPDRIQTISAKREELYSSIFVGGDFRVYQAEVMGSPIYFLSRGEWSSLDEEKIFKILEQTLYNQHEFWEDSIGLMYSVTLLPTEEEWTEYSRSNSIGGSGLTNSFISFASNNPGTTPDRIRWLYNHELLHKWLNGKMRNESEEKHYWFSEGFTDYYAYKLMFMKDHLYLSEYLDVINQQVLTPHYSSDVGQIPNDSITWNRFWADYNVHKLPYRRGFIYALLIDQQIRRSSNNSYSLNKMMKELYAESMMSDKKFNHLIFRKYLVNYLGQEAINDFERYILNGEYINLENDLPEGLKWSPGEIPEIQLSGDSSQVIHQMKL